MSTISSFIVKNDITFFYAINRKISCKLLNNIMKIVTNLGSTTFALFIFSLLCLFRSSLGIMLALNLILSQAIIHLLKRIINRPRPYRILEWVIAINPPDCKYSLPSGHSSSALSIALVMSSMIPGLRLICLTLAFMVGLSSIYLGCHYPTDVIVGFVISLMTYIYIVPIFIF